MAWKRKGTFRRRRVFKRRFVRKSRSFGRRKRIGNQVYTFKRTWTTATLIAAGSTAPYLGTFGFQLSQLPSDTDFTNLYEQYKISGVKMKFYQPYQNGAASMTTQAGSTVTTQPMIRMHSAFDPNDNSSAGISALQQYSTYRCQELTSPTIGKQGCLKFFYRPKVAALVANASLVASGYGSPKSMWLDCDYPSIVHYGFKWAFEPIYSDGTAFQFTQAIQIPVSLTYYLKFKGTR